MTNVSHRSKRSNNVLQTQIESISSSPSKCRREFNTKLFTSFVEWPFFFSSARRNSIPFFSSIVYDIWHDSDEKKKKLNNWNIPDRIRTHETHDVLFTHTDATVHKKKENLLDTEHKK